MIAINCRANAPAEKSVGMIAPSLKPLPSRFGDCFFSEMAITEPKPEKETAKRKKSKPLQVPFCADQNTFVEKLPLYHSLNRVDGCQVISRHERPSFRNQATIDGWRLAAEIR